MQQMLQRAMQAATGHEADALATVAEELSRATASVAAAANQGDGTATGSVFQVAVDPSMRVHNVMVAVPEEIPLEVFWPMVREDITGAVQEFYPRGMPAQVQESLMSGTVKDGAVPIARRLTLEEAE